MTWFKVDDTLAFHGKVVQAGNAAMGLWVRAGSWSAQQLTDGFVPNHIVATLGTKAQAEALADVELWGREDGGYRFHGWLDYNPTAAEVRADQARKHEAKVNAGRAGGLASGVARRKHTRSKDEADAKQDPKQNGSETKPRPDPSRPVPLDTSVEGEPHVSSGPGEKAPRYPDHCPEHTDEPTPPPCGRCMETRTRRAEAPEVLPDYRLRVVPPLCGECDERWIETPDGWAKCPRCYPQEVSA